MDEVSRRPGSDQSYRLDPLLFGRRLRHLRTGRGLTLRQLGRRVGKHAPYLSQVETGKREPSLSLIGALAEALGVAPADLLSAEAPSRRAELEIMLEHAQRDSLWHRDLGLPHLTPSARIPTAVLESVVRLFRELKSQRQVRAETPQGARRANAALRRAMRERDNYFVDIEQRAAAALNSVGYTSGPLSQPILEALAGHFGYRIHPVPELPRSVRSLTDKRHRLIYIPHRNQVGAPRARSVIVQTVGHIALDHEEPRDFSEFLRQRVEANYFAGAVLLPERSAVPLLRDAQHRRDLAVEDLEERFYVSYEMAAHRFTNLATRHLGLRVHFVRSDEEGVIWKAYENDGIPFPVDADGAIEGQLLCRHWGARRIFGAEQRFSAYQQHTDTPTGSYWSSTYLETGRASEPAITIGTPSQTSSHFRGGDTELRVRSGCPEEPCCRRPRDELTARWSGHAWPSPRPHSHVLAALPAGTFPGIDLAEVYEFLDRQAPA
jgi:predicted transcriptional regulator/transcriptional regulator with XRE-family HTH domain